MVKRRNWIHLFLVILILVSTQAGRAASDSWQSVGNGVDYQEFHLPDPNNVYVARMDRHNPQVILDSGIAKGMLRHGPETVSDMALRYDGAINTWDGTWGARNKVIVAINGSFFYNPSGTPMSGQITSGWYAKRFDDLGGGSGFAWKMDRSAFIGKCVYHRPEKQVVTFLANGAHLEINGVNALRGTDQLILYTPQFGVNTATNDYGTEVTVEMTAPTSIQPYPAVVRGVITSVNDGVGSSDLYFDSIVLSAHGAARQALLANAHVGDEVGISQEITHLQTDCVAKNPVDWTKTYASINGSFELVLNGKLQSSEDPGATNHQPRTAIAYNDDYIYFIVVDGRSKASIGMTIQELGRFAKNTLGATWGLAQDGGGSSTMVVNGMVKNHPSDPCYTIFLPLVLDGAGKVSVGPGTGLPPSHGPGICPRKVANSMMMIEVQPEQKSQVFAPENLVRAIASAAVRLGPGTNYAALAVAPRKSIGVIKPDFNKLDGVYAKGAYWWYVDFGKVTGWVDQQSINYIDPLNLGFSPFR